MCGVQFSWGLPVDMACSALTKQGSVLLGRLHQPLVPMHTAEKVTAAALSPLMPRLAYACGSTVHLARPYDKLEIFRVAVPSEAAREAKCQASISSLRWLGPRSLLAAGAIINEVGRTGWHSCACIVRVPWTHCDAAPAACNSLKRAYHACMHAHA